MAELVEYGLVFMVSTMFVAGSVLVYGRFSSLESGISLRSTFEAVSGLVARAANGSASATITLPTATIDCENGVLGVWVGGSSLNETVPLECRFSVNITGGVHTLEIHEGRSLNLTVA